jgi:hypothetical protein
LRGKPGIARFCRAGFTQAVLSVGCFSPASDFSTCLRYTLYQVLMAGCLRANRIDGAYSKGGRKMTGSRQGKWSATRSRGWAALVALVLLWCPYGAVAATYGCLEGNGIAGRQERSLAAFDRIALQGVFEVSIQLAAQPSCAVSGDSNLLDQVRTQVVDGELRIDTRGSLCLKLPLQLDIHLPALTALRVDGSDQVQVTGLRGERFALQVAGVSRVELRGEVDQLEARLEGTSELQALDLRVQRAEVLASGTAQAHLQVVEQLQVMAADLAQIFYRGAAVQLVANLSGLASVTPLAGP